MLHPETLALLGVSCVPIRQPWSKEGPRANRDMSSLIVSKITALGSDLAPFPHPQDADRLTSTMLAFLRLHRTGPAEWAREH